MLINSAMSLKNFRLVKLFSDQHKRAAISPYAVVKEKGSRAICGLFVSVAGVPERAGILMTQLKGR